MSHCVECGALLPMHQTWCKQLGQMTVGDPMAQQYTSLLRRVKELEADNAALRTQLAQATEAVQTLNAGRPLGDIVGLQTARNALADNAALRAELDQWKRYHANLLKSSKECEALAKEELQVAERERDTAIKYLAEHLAERSILHDAKAAEFDPEATAFAAGMRRAAEVCQNGGADWAFDLIITDLERLEE